MLELHLCDLILSYSSELVVLVFFLDLNFDVVHFIIITKGGNEADQILLKLAHLY